MNYYPYKVGKKILRKNQESKMVKKLFDNKKDNNCLNNRGTFL